MIIHSVHDAAFSRYGFVREGDFSALINAAKAVALPESGSAYEPSVETLEKAGNAKKVYDGFFGGLDAQIGLCYGHNNRMSALEWHACPEINTAASDFILLLGDVRDLTDGGRRYDSARLEAFLVKAGETVELYAGTLHFCPIEASADGFRCVVGLLRGTNTLLPEKTDDDRLFKTNKWLLCHKDNAALLAKGAVGGIDGDDIAL